MDKLSRVEVIVTLSLIAPLFLVFIEHDEGFVLFLIELVFMAIIGLMYIGAVLVVCVLWELIERIYRYFKK